MKAVFRLSPIGTCATTSDIFRIAETPEQALKMALRDYPDCVFEVEYEYEFKNVEIA